LNSTRSTLLKVNKVDRVALVPYTRATKSKGRSTFGQQSWPYRQQCWNFMNINEHRFVKVNLLTAYLSHRNYATVIIEPELGWTDSSTEIYWLFTTSDWIVTWLINIQVVAEQTGNKVERATKLNVQLCCRFVAGSTKSTMLNWTLLPVCTGLYYVNCKARVSVKLRL